MRTGRLILAVAMLLALAGCAPAGQQAASSPTARATPVFASDAEALAAAEKAYAAYLKVSASITSAGGSSPSLIDTFVTESEATTEHRTYKYFSDGGLRSQGSPSLGPMNLEHINYDTSGIATLVVHACIDASNVRILDSSGVDVTPADRLNMTPLEITMRSSAEFPTKLLVAGSKKWFGSEACS